MIKINLLRNTGTTQGGGISALGAAGGSMSSAEAIPPDVMKQAATKFLLILLFPVCLYLYEQFNLSELQRETADVQNKIQVTQTEQAKYGDVTPRVEKFNVEKKRIDEEVAVVRTIARNRLREVKSLDLLQNLTPQQAWFKKVSIEGSAVKVEGYSRDDAGINDLIRKLEGSVFFQKVEPKGLTQETLPTGIAKKFSLEFAIGKQE